jgi:hypothetical protein
MSDATIKTPYLIQRGEIKRPLMDESCRLSEAVSLDYMGSAEYEFGALPASLRAMQAMAVDLQKTVLKSVANDDAPLKVIHSMSADGFKQYEKHLLALRNGALRTKEVSRFAHDYPMGKYTHTDFWWDIQNSVMWSFDKEFMNRLPAYLASSWRYMDSAKKAA